MRHSPGPGTSDRGTWRGINVTSSFSLIAQFRQQRLQEHVVIFQIEFAEYETPMSLSTYRDPPSNI